MLASKHFYAYINIVKLQQTISPTSLKAQRRLYTLFWPDHNSLLCRVDDVPLSTSHTHLWGFSSVSFHRSSYKIQFSASHYPILYWCSDLWTMSWDVFPNETLWVSSPTFPSSRTTLLYPVEQRTRVPIQSSYVKKRGWRKESRQRWD